MGTNKQERIEMDTKADIASSRKIYAKYWRTEVGWYKVQEFLPELMVPLPYGASDCPSWRHHTFAYLNHYIPEYDVMEVGIMEHTGYRAMLMRGGDQCGELDFTPNDFSVSVLFPSYRGFTQWFATYDDALKFAGEWMRAHMKGMSDTERDRDRYGGWE